MRATRLQPRLPPKDPTAGVARRCWAHHSSSWVIRRHLIAYGLTGPRGMCPRGYRRWQFAVPVQTEMAYARWAGTCHAPTLTAWADESDPVTIRPQVHQERICPALDSPEKVRLRDRFLHLERLEHARLPVAPFLNRAELLRARDESICTPEARAATGPRDREVHYRLARIMTSSLGRNGGFNVDVSSCRGGSIDHSLSELSLPRTPGHTPANRLRPSQGRL